MINLGTFEIISIASLLGLTAGISPGPVLTLVVTQTLQHNKKEGIKVALSPLITDLPIILLSVFLFSRLSNLDTILGVISFTGAIFIIFLAYESFTTKGLIYIKEEIQSHSLKKGIITNLLNPHPYLFWVTVGSPLLFRALTINTLTMILFLVSFYLFLVGSKVVLAMVVERSKVFINSVVYAIIMKILGIILLVFAMLFIFEGMSYFNVSL